MSSVRNSGLAGPEKRSSAAAKNPRRNVGVAVVRAVGRQDRQHRLRRAPGPRADLQHPEPAARRKRRHRLRHQAGDHPVLRPRPGRLPVHVPSHSAAPRTAARPPASGRAAPRGAPRRSAAGVRSPASRPGRARALVRRLRPARRTLADGDPPASGANPPARTPFVPEQQAPRAQAGRASARRPPGARGSPRGAAGAPPAPPPRPGAAPNPASRARRAPATGRGPPVPPSSTSSSAGSRPSAASAGPMPGAAAAMRSGAARKSAGAGASPQPAGLSPPPQLVEQVVRRLAGRRGGLRREPGEDPLPGGRRDGAPVALALERIGRERQPAAGAPPGKDPRTRPGPRLRTRRPRPPRKLLPRRRLGTTTGTSPSPHPSAASGPSTAPGARPRSAPRPPSVRSAPTLDANRTGERA